MLKFFNRLERTRNFVLLLFGILMVLSLVLFYAPTRNNFSENLARSEETAAKVSGEKISVGELYRQKELVSQYMQGRELPAKSVLSLPLFGRPSLLDGRVIRVEAERLCLTATDTEVAADVRESLKNPDGTTTTQEKYEQNATERAGSVSAFEERVRDEISGRKLEAFLTSGITVSEEEVLNDFRKKNTKFDLSYVM